MLYLDGDVLQDDLLDGELLLLGEHGRYLLPRACGLRGGRGSGGVARRLVDDSYEDVEVAESPVSHLQVLARAETLLVVSVHAARRFLEVGSGAAMMYH